MKPKAKLCCPECGSERLYKAGLRYLKDGYTVQRWLCRNCGYRFSEPKVKVNVTTQSLKSLNSESDFLNLDITKRYFPIKERCDSLSFQRRKHVTSHTSSKGTITEKVLNTFGDYNRECQVCDLERRSKNLVATEQKQTVAGTLQKTTQQNIKGKILEFAWHLKKNGFAESTIKRYIQSCNTLRSYGADILDPESVKGTIAKQKWQDGTKLNYVNFYDTFIKFLGLTWQKPRYKHSRKLPFIPLESEIDLLIHGTGKKISITLQIIKETGMRIGEVMRLKWIDIDTERNIITLNYAEKHGNNRMFKVSSQLIQRILLIPKKSEDVFNRSKISVTSNFYMVRKRIAHAYNNPRLLRISFHTLRHWKATTEYHKTKDILHVKNMLGHQSIDNTLIYITLEQTLFGSTDKLEFHVKVAHNIEEACELVKVGFDYICDMEDCKIFRKRK